jgi:hypothetical protein
MHAGKIRSAGGGVGREAGEISLLDQLGGRRSDHELIKDVAEPPAVQFLRCRRGAEHVRLGQRVEDAQPRRSNGVMGFINDQQIGCWDEPMHAPRNRLHGGDLHREHRQLGISGGDDTVIDAKLIERLGNLLHDLIAVPKDDDAVAARGGTGDNSGEENRFSAPGWSLIEHTAPASREARPQPLDVSLLVGP